MAASLSFIETPFNINQDVLLSGEGEKLDKLCSSLSKFITSSTSSNLSFVLDSSILQTSLIPLSKIYSTDELADFIETEFNLIVGDKKSSYIYEWVPVQNNKILIFWVPEIAIARLQLISSKLGKNLTIVDIEPLSIINLVTERNLVPETGRINVIIKFDDDAFCFLAYNNSEIVFFKTFFKYNLSDCSFHLLKVLNEYMIELATVSNIYWYGKEIHNTISGLNSLLSIKPENLFESLRILYFRNNESADLHLESSLASLSIGLRNES